MRPALFAALLAAVASAQTAAPAQSEQRVTYTKKFPGSDPAYVSISLDRAGHVSYKEDPDDDAPDTFQLEPQFTDTIFQLAAKVDHFKKTLESGLKVANMGAKTFRWEDGNDAGQTTFNYSTDLSAQALWNWFEWMTDSQRAFLELNRAVRHDKLGVNDALLKITDLWTGSKLVGTPQFLPLFDRVAGDDSYIHIARERAAELAEAVRAAGK
jgi:hypothetical protein